MFIVTSSEKLAQLTRELADATTLQECADALSKHAELSESSMRYQVPRDLRELVKLPTIWGELALFIYLERGEVIGEPDVKFFQIHAIDPSVALEKERAAKALLGRTECLFARMFSIARSDTTDPRGPVTTKARLQGELAETARLARELEALISHRAGQYERAVR